MHHIIPKSLGGTDSKNNLVKLTGREHFVCHWLLVKMTDGAQYEKMVYALNGMRRTNKNQKRYDTKITSRIYQKYKQVAAEIRSIRQRGVPQTLESNLKRSKTQLGKKRGPMSDSHRANMIAAITGVPRPSRKGVTSPLKGKSYSEIMGEEKAAEVLRKRSIAWTNRQVSEQTKMKQSTMRAGKNLGSDNSNAKSFVYNDIEYKTIELAIEASGLSRYKFNKLYRGFKDKSRKKS